MSKSRPCARLACVTSLVLSVASGLAISAAPRSAAAADWAQDAIAADLRERTISADELERARKPAVETLMTLQTNRYWSFELLGIQTDPRRLDVIRNTVANLKAVSAADIQRTAQKYLTAAKTWRAEIKPESAGPADPMQ